MYFGLIIGGEICKKYVDGNFYLILSFIDGNFYLILNFYSLNFEFLKFFRFNGMFMAIPTVGTTILLVVILMVIIRMWMIGAPKYTRKHVRFPNRFKYPNPDDKLQAKPRYV